MIFRECSIAGKLYKGEPDVPEEKSSEDEKVEVAEIKPEDTSVDGPSTSSTNDTVPPVERTPPDPATVSKVKLSASVLQRFRNETLSADMAHSADTSNRDRTFSEGLRGFFTVLGLCHTVLAVVDSDTNAIEYKAQSPDEAALVQAAADVGFIFRGREREILRLQTPFSSDIEEYELLNLLDFNSVRKRMSVIVRRIGEGNDGKVMLLTKGADNVIFERLRKDESEEMKTTTEQHLDEFASDGE